MNDDNDKKPVVLINIETVRIVSFGEPHTPYHPSGRLIEKASAFGWKVADLYNEQTPEWWFDASPTERIIWDIYGRAPTGNVVSLDAARAKRSDKNGGGK